MSKTTKRILAALLVLLASYMVTPVWAQAVGSTGIHASRSIHANKIVAAYNSTAADKASADYICDGTADQIEINAAIATFGADVSGGVRLCAGNYDTSDKITLNKRGCVLSGPTYPWAKPDGINNGAQINVPSSKFGIEITGQFAAVVGVALDGTGHTGHIGIDINASDTTVENCSLTSLGIGLHITGGKNQWIRHNWIEFNGVGMSLANWTGYNWITENIFSLNTTTDIRIGYVNANFAIPFTWITRNKFGGLTTSGCVVIHTSPCVGLRFQGNMGASSGSAGTVMPTVIDVTSTLVDAVIEGNYFYDTAFEAGSGIAYADWSTVSGGNLQNFIRVANNVTLINVRERDNDIHASYASYSKVLYGTGVTGLVASDAYAAIPVADQNDSTTIWNDNGVLKVSSAP